MKLNTILGVFSVIAAGDGVVAMLAPGPFANLIWPDRLAPEAHLFVQGWGACLLAFSVLAATARRLTDPAARRAYASILFIYHGTAAIVWAVDAAVRGWTPLSVASLVGLVLFALAFGWFRFANSQSISEDVRTARTAA